MDPATAALLEALAMSVAQGVAEGVTDAVKYHVERALGVPGGNNLGKVLGRLDVIDEKLTLIISALKDLRIYIHQEFIDAAILSYRDNIIANRNTILTAIQDTESDIDILVSQALNADGDLMQAADPLISNAEDYGFSPYLAVIMASTTHLAALDYTKRRAQVPAFAKRVVAYCNAALNEQDRRSIGYLWAIHRDSFEKNRSAWVNSANIIWSVYKHGDPMPANMPGLRWIGVWPEEGYRDLTVHSLDNYLDWPDFPFTQEEYENAPGLGNYQDYFDRHFREWRTAAFNEQAAAAALKVHVDLLTKTRDAFQHLAPPELASQKQQAVAAG